VDIKTKCSRYWLDQISGVKRKKGESYLWERGGGGSGRIPQVRRSNRLGQAFFVTKQAKGGGCDVTDPGERKKRNSQVKRKDG